MFFPTFSFILSILNPMDSRVIEARGLSKLYGKDWVVKGIDFDIEAGECFGFLGPNGAGKTSIIKMITCMSPLSAGSLKVFGMDVASRPREIKSMLGIVPQEELLDTDLSVYRNLIVYGRYHGISKSVASTRADEVLHFLQLYEKRDSKVDTLSGGMKRRLLIARSLINDPELMVMDEPTTGLDPQARHVIWAKLKSLKAEGKTVLLTTHYMEEAHQLCDRIVIMDKGDILARGNPREMVSAHVGSEVIEIGLDGRNPQEVYDTLDGMDFSSEAYGDTLYIFLAERGSDAMRRISGGNFKDYHIRPATLEDVFLKLTGRELVD